MFLWNVKIVVGAIQVGAIHESPQQKLKYIETPQIKITEALKLVPRMTSNSNNQLETIMVTFFKFNPEKHHRRSIRLQNWDYSSPGIYFVTMRVKKNSVHFCRTSSGKVQLNDLGRIVADSWLDIPNHYENVELDEWIVMPDHFHGLVIIKERITKNNWNEIVGAIHESPQINSPQQRNNRRKMLLSKIIGRFKMVSAKQINLKLHSSGKIWQRDYYEHIVRNKDSLTCIRKYIQTNPDKLNAF